MNGIRSDVRSFKTSKSIEKVVKFYRNEWKKPVKKDQPGYIESLAMAPWYLITRIDDGYLMTVQAQVIDKGKGTWGYLAVSPLPDIPDPDEEVIIGENIPQMHGSRVVNEVISDDPGKKASTVIIINDHSVSSNASFYRNYYNNKGWSVETDLLMSNGKLHSLVFKSNRNRITMMIGGDNKNTNIVINSVTGSIF